jgi:hypothetical protein
MNPSAFGVLTLATPNDYLKAIGLALSVRVSNPGVPIAVACSERVGALVAPYFDKVILEKAGLKGFVHKVYLDQYSPFEETVFFDSDVLIFKPILPFIESWRQQPYAACGHYFSDGFSAFGFDRAAVLKKINKQRLVVIDGAGHAYFRKPACDQVFEMARDITSRYEEYVGKIPYADEDVMNIVMTLQNLPPADYGYFFARYLSARRGTMEMDATRAHCRFISKMDGRPFEPCMIHFAANEAALSYTWQLMRLFKKFNVPTQGLLALGLHDFYESEIKHRLYVAARRLGLKK